MGLSLSGIASSVINGAAPLFGVNPTNVLDTQYANLTGQKVPGLNAPSGNYYSAQPAPQQNQPAQYLGPNTNTGSTSQDYGTNNYLNYSTPAPDYTPQIASLNTQIGTLRNTLGDADTQLAQGTQNINDQYNQQASAANLQRSRALQDFQTQNQNDNIGHQQAIDQVNTKARTLANSVRQMIGNASGSGSSAYQIAAPDAVQRQADLQSQDINNNYGQNATALKTAQDRATQDFNNFFTNLDNTKTQSLNSLNSGIQGQKEQINGQLADLAAQLAAYKGGGAAAAQAAANPYVANAGAASQAIKDIANNYKSPFQSVTPVTVAAPTLRDYVNGQTQVSANPNSNNGTATTPTYNPLASWLKQNQDQNQYAI